MCLLVLFSFRGWNNGLRLRSLKSNWDKNWKDLFFKQLCVNSQSEIFFICCNSLKWQSCHLSSVETGSIVCQPLMAAYVAVSAGSLLGGWMHDAIGSLYVCPSVLQLLIFRVCSYLLLMCRYLMNVMTCLKWFTEVFEPYTTQVSVTNIFV